jgi:DNA-binding NarL/FixJ family response regulator
MRIVIAEDSVLLRAGLTRLLADAGNEVVATVENAADLLVAVATHQPDVCVVDVRMPPTFTDEGIQAAVEIRRTHPGVAVLVLSQYVEESYASDLLAGGSIEGVGYLLKDRVADVREFIEALQRVADGGTAIDPEVVAQLMARRSRSPLTELTARETEVLGLMAEGRSNGGIADALVVSAGAVEKHVNNIFRTTLKLHTECSSFIGANCSVSYELAVPEGVTVTGSSSGGGIRTEAITGSQTMSSSGGGITVDKPSGEVKVDSSGGGITVTEPSGDVSANSSGGGIRIVGSRSNRVVADSSGGGIDVDFDSPPTQVDVSSSGGGITVRLPPGETSYAVDASSSGGGTDVEVRTDPASANRVKARSSGGGVTVRYATAA